MKQLQFITFFLPIAVMSQELPKMIKVPLTSIQFRNPRDEEIQSLKFEHQAGMELMFWLSKLEADTLSKDITLAALNNAFDSLNSITRYPIAEYNSLTRNFRIVHSLR